MDMRGWIREMRGDGEKKGRWTGGDGQEKGNVMEARKGDGHEGMDKRKER